jgi:hypothetical protein
MRTPMLWEFSRKIARIPSATVEGEEKRSSLIWREMGRARAFLK